MSDFKLFSNAVYNKFISMSKGELFTVDIDSYELQELYLESFPSGTNTIYRVRGEYDCSCCKSFIRKMGNVVSIIDGKLVTIWDIDVKFPFNVVAEKLSQKVKSSKIKTVFLNNTTLVGSEYTREQLEDGSLKKWDHFHCVIDKKFISNDIAEKRSEIESSVSVFERGLKELSVDALQTIKDLITSKSLYRGEEHLSSINDFIALKTKYDKIKTDKDKNIFIWDNFKNKSIRFKNTVIGTLASDLSEGKDITTAVNSFESKVAPQNYKRTSALITPNMVKDATSTIQKLGIEDSLYRRHALVEDVSVNDIIWANRSTKSKMKGGIESLLSDSISSKTKVDQSKATDITIDEFIKSVVPTANAMSIYFDNGNVGNLMTITAPKVSSSKNIFKWPNNFAWSYNGDITDSIKERVKKAGGNIDAKFRVSLSWFNYDDLDIHCLTPSGKHICFWNKEGILDVDMNAGSATTREPVENLAFNHFEKGTYQVYVKNYNKRESINVGFTVETEYNGLVETFIYTKAVRDSESINVIDFTSDGKKVEISKVYKGIESGSTSKKVWGIDTKQFVDINMMMLSPNYWGDSMIGNKHYFFIINKCKNPDSLRGIYNEFLDNDLNKHRKVFELLGEKTKCEYSDEQLSGIGFSSTKNETVIVKVESDKSSRLFNIKF